MDKEFQNKPTNQPTTSLPLTARGPPTIAEAEAAPAAEDFELTDAQLAGEPVPLKVVKFRAVNVLTIFVASNRGGADATAVGAIRVLGSAGDSFNVAAIKDLSKEHDH